MTSAKIYGRLGKALIAGSRLSRIEIKNEPRSALHDLPKCF
ncbi:hypothetical protein PALB_26830 [Pseudoalteromonas luteoviolacea B = ATCC 29581]|nr:hypothetical protein PALB_26830 [Pseudoalteromonas luteoviolacea B = ATCC 29581]